MTTRSCRAVITNRGFMMMDIALRGGPTRVVLLDVTIVDEETGEVLNRERVHSAENDVLTIIGGYEKVRGVI